MEEIQEEITDSNFGSLCMEILEMRRQEQHEKLNIHHRQRHYKFQQTAFKLWKDSYKISKSQYLVTWNVVYEHFLRTPSLLISDVFTIIRHGVFGDQ